MSQSFSAFVINLPKDTDRRIFMETQLQKVGISYDIMEAVLGTSDKVSYEYDDVIAKKENGKSLSLGERGCAISHKMIYEKIVSDHIPYALILEDDAVLPENFKSVVEHEIANRNKKWDMLLFEYLPTGIVYVKAWIKGSWINSKKNPLFFLYALCKAPYMVFITLYETIQKSFAKKNPGPRIFLRPLYHASAYILTEEGARKMLKLTSPVRFSADRLPNQARVNAGLRLRGYVPLIVRQNKTFFSNIT